MENLELRIQKLERKYRILKYSVLFLMSFTVYAGLSGTASIGSFAAAQQKTAAQQETAASAEKEAAGVPVVVEAEVFLLKDVEGNIRGVWSVDGETTSFAMKNKEKYPIIAMAVDNKNASMSLTDSHAAKISIGLNDSIRSIAIMDDTRKNNIYLGLTGTGEAAFDMISKGNAAMVIDGATASLDMSGDTSVLALTETVGGMVALKAQPSSSMLTFMDYQNKATTTLSTIDGKSQLYMNSPSLKEEKTIDTMPEENLSFEETKKDDEENEASENEVQKEGKASEEKPEKKDEKKEENKVVNMKTYSPFSK